MGACRRKLWRRSIFVSIFTQDVLTPLNVVIVARTGEMGHAYVTGLQSGRRRNVSSTANARMAATCKHFAAFGSPQGGL